jgi:hypothetical protein
VTRSGRLAAHRDLVLECLALRHQLGVLARSVRRFRPSDRVFWLCLRRWWPRWKDALMLVQPATVDRWQREGFRGCWRLWGAPRIHGELLKLGFTVSERTVSRYLPKRLRASSQAWRTFLANHVGDLVLSSTLTSCGAVSGDDGGGDGYVVSFGCAPTYLRRRTRPGGRTRFIRGNWITAGSGFLCKYLQSGRQRHLMASRRPRNACQRATLAAVRILARPCTIRTHG